MRSEVLKDMPAFRTEGRDLPPAEPPEAKKLHYVWGKGRLYICLSEQKRIPIRQQSPADTREEASKVPPSRSGALREVMLIGFLEVDKADTVYRDFGRAIISAVLLMALLMLGVLFFLDRRVQAALNRYRESVERIGREHNFSDRMDPNVRFREMVLLLEAHNRLLDRVEEVIDMQKEFNHNVSHELRTPISVIRAQCQLLKERYVGDEGMQDSISRILRQNDRMNRMIQMLLEISRLDAKDNSAAISEEIRLDDYIGMICENYGEEKFELALDEITVNANPELVISMYDNILSNAIKYGRSDRPIEVSLAEEDGYAVCRVRDHGPGIPEEEEPKIFRSFYRADKSRSEEGFGLGLPLAK